MVYSIANSTSGQTGTHSSLSMLPMSVLYLEYCACIWDPYLLRDVELLQNVQKFTLKVCCKRWSSPYQDLFDVAEMSSLQARQEVARLGYGYLYKLVHNLIDFPEAPIQYTSVPPYRTRHRNPLTLELHHCRTSRFLNSFFPRTSSHWNSLPTDTYFKLDNMCSYLNPSFLSLFSHIISEDTCFV